ncbi:MAG TPA: GspH/FimT family protein [Burkholderiaceae bacterium]|nr:GspH/FimT family protein [Burkholderiaceae bacterium]
MLGVVTAIAIPAFGKWLNTRSSEVAAHALLRAINTARQNAVIRLTTTTIAPIEYGNWESGWTIFEDLNANATIDEDERLIHVESAVAPGVTINANKPVSAYLMFDPSGASRMSNGAFQAGTLAVCNSTSTHEIVLSSGGRPRLGERSGNRCTKKNAV